MDKVNATVKGQFTALPTKLGELDYKNRFIDIAVYFVISSFRSGNTSKVSYDKITKVLHISKRDAIQAVSELIEKGFFIVKKEMMTISLFNHNKYFFNKAYDCNFEMISPDLLKKGLKAKQIGLLIYLKLNSISGWYYYKDYSDLARKLGCTRQTASKLIKELGEYFKASKAGGIQFTNTIFTFKKEIDIIIPTISMDGTPDSNYEKQNFKQFIAI